MSSGVISCSSSLQPARVSEMATTRRVARTAETGFMALFLSLLSLILDSLLAIQALGDSDEVCIRYLSVKLYRVGRVMPSRREAWAILKLQDWSACKMAARSAFSR